MNDNNENKSLKNWIDNHPLPAAISIVIPTIALTLVTAKFIVFDNPEQEYKAQVETSKLTAENYQSQITVLKSENEKLQKELQETKLTRNQYCESTKTTECKQIESENIYLKSKNFEFNNLNNQLSKQIAECSDKAAKDLNLKSNIDFVEKKNKELEDRNKELQEKLTQYQNNKGNQTTAVSLPQTSNSQQIRSVEPYSYGKADLGQGKTFLDPRTKASIGIQQFYSGSTAKASVSIPGSPTKDISIYTGQTFDFDFKNSKYRLLVTKVDWASDLCSFEIMELQ